MATELDNIKGAYDAKAAKAELDASGEEKDRGKVGLNLLDNMNASLLAGLAFKEGAEGFKELTDKRSVYEKFRDEKVELDAMSDRYDKEFKQGIYAEDDTAPKPKDYEEGVNLKEVDSNGEVSNKPFRVAFKSIASSVFGVVKKSRF